MRFSLLVILESLALSHAGSYHDTFDLWSFDVSDGLYADWMYHIADNTPLSSLSIPGTQSSMTDKLEEENLQTQSTPLAMQLTGGIRYIDISLQNGNDILLVTHRKAFTGYRLDDVLTTIYDFLDQHPHETVVLHIKMGNPLDKSQIFTELLTGYLSPGTPIGNRAAQHVYSNGPDGIITIPTLGEVRGKILILQDFNSDSYGQFGLPWSSPLISSHYFNFEAAKSVQVKWPAIKTYMTSLRRRSTEKLHITGTTTSAGVSPISIAAGTKGDPGFNSRLGDYFSKSKIRRLGSYLLGAKRGYAGVMVMDFPGNALVERILKFNKIYEISHPTNGRVHK